MTGQKRRPSAWALLSVPAGNPDVIAVLVLVVAEQTQGPDGLPQQTGCPGTRGGVQTAAETVRSRV